MGKRLKPTADSSHSPFGPEAFSSEKLGAGQDNIVRTFTAPELGGLVVKISQQKGEGIGTSQEAFESTLYKKKKYEILKSFLGDYIPESHFLVGSKLEGRRDPQLVPKSYTVQQRVPNFRLDQLTPEQRHDPALLRQMYVLLRKLNNMYRAIDKVNEITGNSALDGKLDLGGISKVARMPQGPGFDAARVVEDFQSSPNLLVDPDTLRLYCIDFDDGVWNDEKEAAKGVLEHLISSDMEIKGVIMMDPNLPASA